MPREAGRLVGEGWTSGDRSRRRPASPRTPVAARVCRGVLSRPTGFRHRRLADKYRWFTPRGPKGRMTHPIWRLTLPIHGVQKVCPPTATTSSVEHPRGRRNLARVGPTTPKSIDPSTLRSIRPKRARRPSDALVDPTDVRRCVRNPDKPSRASSGLMKPPTARNLSRYPGWAVGAVALRPCLRRPPPNGT
jgi:hypothetical protein